MQSDTSRYDFRVVFDVAASCSDGGPTMSKACPPLVTMKILRELFPNKHEVTVWRWRKVMPEPDLVVGHVDLWELDTILGWCEGRRLTPDAGVVERIIKEQS